MLAFVKSTRRLALLASLVVVSFASAIAGPAPQIAVPQPPWGYPGQPAQGFEGCYRIDQHLYGPYLMSFCLDNNGNGSYRVTGGGLDCNGGLNWWHEGNGQAQINLYESLCGAGMRWTADTITCSIPPLQAVPQIAVPVPSGGSLSCLYQPSVRGHVRTYVRAHRTGTSTSGGPGCLVVVNVAPWDALNVRATAHAAAPIVDRLVPDHHGIIRLDDTCQPLNIPWGSRWCPITHYNGSSATQGYVKARFVRDSNCP